jgi:hypothetical protein
MVELLPGQQLDALPLETLIDLTKHTLFGPKTWSPLCLPPPSVSHCQWVRVKNLDPRLRIDSSTTRRFPSFKGPSLSGVCHGFFRAGDMSCIVIRENFNAMISLGRS